MNPANGKNGQRSGADLEALLVRAAATRAGETLQDDCRLRPLHPAWEIFIRYCGQLGHGELERLKIQDGLPILAEVTTRKVKFS